MQQDWGRIAANFMRDQWICLNFLIKTVGIPQSMETSGSSQTLKVALSCSVEALALLPSDLVLPVLTFMETLLPQVSLTQALHNKNKVFSLVLIWRVFLLKLSIFQLVHDAEALCVEAVTLSWELVQGLSTNAHDFWPALKGFITMAFHHKLLLLTHTQAPTLKAKLKQVIQPTLLKRKKRILFFFALYYFNV